ncbi:MAG: dihydropteroate synthase [Nitrospirae bacterium]|nr:dihydropteroate synthase [Nitrospirota bacterium]
MGILNVTPDSFSDGGRFVVGGGRVDGFSRVDVAAAVEAALLMAEAGADIIDVGGESTRPGSDRVSPDEEQARVVPVIEGIRKRSGIPISIDTYKAATALAAVRAGADIINDISGLAFDPDMPKAAADSGAALVVMHIKGTPEDMQKDPRYEDLMGEVTGFLAAGAEKALLAGVPGDRILVDPGIGFGKTLAHNLELINRLDELARLGYPVVLGVSRKAFIGRLTGADDPTDRGDGSVAAAVMGIARGAHIIRAHDVRSAKRAALVADAIMRAGRS